MPDAEDPVQPVPLIRLSGGRELGLPSAAPDLTELPRRDFLRLVAAIVGSGTLAACTGRGDGDAATTTSAPRSTSTTTSSPPSSSIAPSTTTLVPLPDDRWSALEELLEAVRASPDHLRAAADAAVGSGDPAELVAFVRSSILTYPPQTNSWAWSATGRRWGTRATLLGGAGTPREIADLLVELCGRAGIDAKVMTTANRWGSLERRPRALEFSPAISADRLAALAQVLGIEIEPPGDPIDVDGSEARRLVDRLVAAAGDLLTPPGRFDVTPPDEVPVVEVVDGGRARWLVPWSDTSVVEPDEGYEPANLPMPTLALTVSVRTTGSFLTAIPVLAGSWPVEQVAGRSLRVAFRPAVPDLHQMLAIRPASVTTVIPTVSVVGDDVDPDERRATTVVGDAISLSGIVTIDPERESRPGEGPLPPTVMPSDVMGEGVAGDATSVVIRSVRTATFPVVIVEADIVDADGRTVDDLGATALHVSDDGRPAGLTVERARERRRILVLRDGSSSMPAEFSGPALADAAAELTARLTEMDSTVEVMLADVIDEGVAALSTWTRDPEAIRAAGNAFNLSSSRLWRALGEAQTLAPTAIVFVTDGDDTEYGTELTAATKEREAVVAAGPPVIVVAVGLGIAPASVEAMAALSRGALLRSPEPDAVVSALSDLLTAQPAPPYRISVVVPVDGPPTRRLTLAVGEDGPSGSATYEVPPADERTNPPGLCGLYLDVEIDGVRTRRTLAGFPDRPPADATPGPEHVEEVRRAFFGSFVLRVDGRSSTASHQLDRSISALLAARPMVEARDIDELIAALEDPPAVEPVLASALDIPIDGTDGPITFETRPRLTLVTSRLLPGDDAHDIEQVQLDLLPQTQFATTDPDPVTAFQTTMRRTLRLAQAERLATVTSTAGLLADAELVELGQIEGDGQDVIFRATLPWRDVWRVVVGPRSGSPGAAWVIDSGTGSVYGVLADGSGGGQSAAEIDRAFDRAATALDLVSLAGDTAAFLGLWTGFSPAFGYWVDFQKAMMERLRHATKMIDQLGDEDADFTVPGSVLDLGPAACGAGLRSLLEGTKAGASSFLPEGPASGVGRAVEILGLHDGFTQLVRKTGINPGPGVSNACD